MLLVKVETGVQALLLVAVVVVGAHLEPSASPQVMYLPLPSIHLLQLLFAAA
jgi:hypothetical protein